MTSARLTAWVEGRVQGVGFRWWVRSRALELGLSGFAENLVDGRVKVVVEGPDEDCGELLAQLEGDGIGTARAGLWAGRPGMVTRVTHRWTGAAGGMAGFAER